jgi:hypothetical protein
MATHGEIRWPSVGSFDGRLRGDSHGRRHLSVSAEPRPPTKGGPARAGRSVSKLARCGFAESEASHLNRFCMLAHHHVCLRTPDNCRIERHGEEPGTARRGAR